MNKDHCPFDTKRTAARTKEMMLPSFPEWMQAGLDKRFMETANQLGMRRLQPQEVEKSDHLMERIRASLSFDQYQLLLKWDELQNHRNTFEKELMYQAGIKEGLRIARQMQELITE